MCAEAEMGMRRVRFDQPLLGTGDPQGAGNVRMLELVWIAQLRVFHLDECERQDAANAMGFERSAFAASVGGRQPSSVM